MADDLYTEFLEIPPGPRPPNHYEFLGLPLFESDEKRIHAALLSQTAKLRRWHLDPDQERADRVQEMLNELHAAAVTLEKAETREAYNKELAARLRIASLGIIDATAEPESPPRAVFADRPGAQPHEPLRPPDTSVPTQAPIPPLARVLIPEEVGAGALRPKRALLYLGATGLCAAVAAVVLILGAINRGRPAADQEEPVAGRRAASTRDKASVVLGLPAMATPAWPFEAAEAKRRQAETARALGVKPEQDFDLAPGVKITMVLIPAGEFMMGSAVSAREVARLAGLDADKAEFVEGEHPQRRVIIRDPFWMGKHELTQEQWQAVMGRNPSDFKGAKNPVEDVSWNDIQEFLRKVNARVRGGVFVFPTEAQWEYACRAGTQTPFHFGETLSTDQANYRGNYTYGRGRKGVYREKTLPVGSFPANAWGLHDMHGNVCEWCASPYSEKYDGRDEAKARTRVFRGGSWYDNPGFCRSAFSVRTFRSDAWRTYGFRLCGVPRTPE